MTNRDMYLAINALDFFANHAKPDEARNALVDYTDHLPISDEEAVSLLKSVTKKVIDDLKDEHFCE